MVLKIDAKLERKLTRAFKNDMKNLANFHQSTQSLKFKSLMRSFYPEYVYIQGSYLSRQ